MNFSEHKKLPLSSDDLISLFENPGKMISIDYVNSSLKDEAFFTYISNIKIECVLHGYETLPFEEKEKLLNLFIKSKYTMEVFTLKDALCSVFLGPRYSDFFTEEEIERYKANNMEKLEELAQFYYSMLIMVPSISNDFRTLILDADIKDGKIKEIKGTDCITPNVYNLTFYKGFVDAFIGICEKEYPLCYYTDVISNYFYKEKSFFGLLLDKETAPNLISLFNFFFTETEEVEKELLEKLKTA